MPDTPADTRQDRKRCKSPRATGEYAMKGSDYCRWHGGKTLAGAQSLLSLAAGQPWRIIAPRATERPGDDDGPATQPA